MAGRIGVQSVWSTAGARRGMLLMFLGASVLLSATLEARVHAAESNSRKLLQGGPSTTPCDPASGFPNTCYNVNGSSFACCSSSCITNPGPIASCSTPQGDSPTNTPSPSNPPPTGSPSNSPSDPPTINSPSSPPANTAPTGTPQSGAPAPTDATSGVVGFAATNQAAASSVPIFSTGTNVNCATKYAASPNACYGSDGSQFTCCPGACSASPSTTPVCQGAPLVLTTPSPTNTPTPPSPTSTPSPTAAVTSSTSSCGSDVTQCGNPAPSSYVPGGGTSSTAGRSAVSPPYSAPAFKTPPSARPAASGTGQSGTGPASPNSFQTSSAAGTAAGKTVTNSYFYLPSPSATSAGGSVATCTIIGSSNSPTYSSAGVTDDKVFFRSIEHTAACGDGAQWKIRIGTGGQIYYLTSTSNGHSGQNAIGPAQVSGAAYIDRVIQSVAYSTPLVNKLCGPNNVPCDYNMQQGGGFGPEYATLLGSQLSPGGDGVSLISWPRQQQAGVDYQTGDKRYRSNLLLQTWVRDVGQGSFELTWIWTNFGSVNIDFIDLPWAGLGYCPDWTNYALSVPTSKISPDAGCPGGCKFYDHAHCDASKASTFGGANCWDFTYPNQGTGDSGLFNCQTQTNGWMAFTSSNCATARALGVLFAPKSPYEGGASGFDCEVRFGRFVDPNTVYGNILETIKRPVGVPPSGGTLEFRYYITAGATLASVATQAGRLQSFIKETTVTRAASSGDIGLIKAQTKVPASVSFQSLAWYALDKMPANGAPIIIARHRPTGVIVLTSSFYVFSCCTPSGSGAKTCSLTTCVDPNSNTDFLGMIGWGVGVDVVTHPAPSGLNNAVLLSSILPASQFFDPQHPDTEIQKDIYVVKP